MKEIRTAWLALLAPPLLADQPMATDPPARLQAQADRLTPDLPRLQDLALGLREQMVLAAAPHLVKGRR